MNTPPVLLDVNVPMYAAGQEHPLRAACVWVMTEIAEGRLVVAINTETIQEILYRYGALRRWEIAASMAASLMNLVPIIYPVLERDARKAVELFRQYAPLGIKARDLLHAAVMHSNGLTHILSADAHFDRLEGIVRLAPQALFNRAQSGTI